MKKTAKEQPKGVAPIGAIKIIIMSDGGVQVNGFPQDLHVAQSWMDAAKRAIVNYFIDKAKRGELNEKGIVEKKILTRDRSLIGADGKRLQ